MLFLRFALLFPRDFFFLLKLLHFLSVARSDDFASSLELHFFRMIRFFLRDCLQSCVVCCSFCVFYNGILMRIEYWSISDTQTKLIGFCGTLSSRQRRRKLFLKEIKFISKRFVEENKQKTFFSCFSRWEVEKFMLSRVCYRWNNPPTLRIIID